MTRPIDRFGCVPLALCSDQQVTHAAFRLYATLAAHADRHGRCYPSVSTMVDLMGLSKATGWRQITRLIQCLEAAGWIRVNRTVGAVNVYWLVRHSPHGPDGEGVNGQHVPGAHDQHVPGAHDQHVPGAHDQHVPGAHDQTNRVSNRQESESLTNIENHHIHRVDSASPQVTPPTGGGGQPDRQTSTVVSLASRRQAKDLDPAPTLFEVAGMESTPPAPSEPEPARKARKAKPASTTKPKIVLTTEQIETFWNAYPRQEHKGYMIRELNRAIARGIEFETIMDGLRRCVAVWKTDRTFPRYVSKPAVWLGAEGWLDHPSGASFEPETVESLDEKRQEVMREIAMVARQQEEIAPPGFDRFRVPQSQWPDGYLALVERYRALQGKARELDDRSRQVACGYARKQA